MLPTNKSGERGIVDYSARLLTNDNVRFEIAKGNTYRVGYSQDVATGEALWITFDPSLNGTYDDRVYKIKANVTTTARPILMEFCEGATLTDNGTEIVIYNFNRNSDVDASLNTYAKMYHTPTIDSSGNKYAPDETIYADATKFGNINVTAQGEETDEYSAYLHPTKKYLWKFTNIGDETTNIAVAARIIYEQDYKAGGR